MSGANLSIGEIKVFDENLEDFLKKASDNGLNFKKKMILVPCSKMLRLRYFTRMVFI